MDFASIPFVANSTPAAGGGPLTIEAIGTPEVLSIYAGPDLRLAIPSASVGDNIAILVHPYVVTATLGSPITDSAGNVYTDVTPAGWTDGFFLLSEDISSVPTYIDIPWSGGDYIAPAQAFVIGGTVAGVTTFTDTQTFTSGTHTHDYTTPADGCVVLGTFNFDGGGGNYTLSTFDGPATWTALNASDTTSPQSFIRAVATAGAQTLTMTPNTGIASATRGIILSPT